MTKSRGILPPRKAWTTAELDLLKKKYPDARADYIAEALG